MLEELSAAFKAFIPLLIAVFGGSAILAVFLVGAQSSNKAGTPAAQSAAGSAARASGFTGRALPEISGPQAPIAGEVPPLRPLRALASLPRGFVDPSASLPPRDDITIAAYAVETQQGCAPVFYTYTARETPIYRQVQSKSVRHRDGGRETRFSADAFFKSPAGLKVRRDKRQLFPDHAMACAEMIIEITPGPCISKNYLPMTCPPMRLEGGEAFAALRLMPEG